MLAGPGDKWRRPATLLPPQPRASRRRQRTAAPTTATPPRASDDGSGTAATNARPRLSSGPSIRPIRVRAPVAIRVRGEALRGEERLARNRHRDGVRDRPGGRVDPVDLVVGGRA